MPVVNIKILDGRTVAQKKMLVEKMTDAILESIDTERDHISIFIEEVKRSNHALGGVLISEEE